ncbi:ADP-heptose:LPS heptosyltransferase [Enterobacter sp. BIGb0383]|uniref:glycosyltransferase family 9 protein n=1 Tax=unclassified Enterobacter TaxID=2608935 RepID=UPI000FA3A669|nr:MULTISPECIES: glycosyltransferase family 9 protein [unclassified Enterobacter]ROP62137.1 ADP-heptose:LPS heptosyltransferase [Enterobacter sp. BIGb0383]ROS12298.1 ADP-heptose:LPS heptosyltransferase [Enterobacter sp. BIGb0359]
MTTDIMTFPGSLIAADKWIVASWDIEQGKSWPDLQPLSHPWVQNYNAEHGPAAYRDGCRVNVINGMGVTLGDSIVGLCVCHYLKQRYRSLTINIVRPAVLSSAVEAIYRAAITAGIIDSLDHMPWPLDRCQDFDMNIDMGNQLFRADFQRLEMHDYFFLHAGIAPDEVLAEYKSNRWLALNNVDKTPAPYVLFCPGASTPLRAIPARWHAQIIRELQRRYSLPVKGFSSQVVAGYEDISPQITTSAAFIGAIAQASVVYTADSSALHIAAAFNVPTRAIFTSIDPALRTRYYPRTESVWTGDSALLGYHATSDSALLAHCEKRLDDFYRQEGF